MNKSFVKLKPQGDFTDVSALNRGWETKVHILVSEKRAIQFDMYPLESLPQEFVSALSRQGYHDLILQNDQWQHFLVPDSKQGIFRQPVL